MLRTLAGVMVIGLVQMLLLLNGLRQEWQLLITGAIVLGMIMLQAASRAMKRAVESPAGAVPDPRLRARAAGAIDAGGGRVLSLATAHSVLQSFATLGLVALGLGLTMMLREFDLSVAGMLGLAGCIAVLTGGQNPALGLALALGAGCLGGALQGLIMVWPCGSARWASPSAGC